MKAFVLLVFILWSLPGFAKAPFSFGSLTLNADNMDWDSNNKIIKLNGNVQVIFREHHISANSATISQKDRTVHAMGAVVVETPKAHIEGESVFLNYETKKGYITNGYIQSGQVMFEGEYIERLSDEDYVASKSHFTACETCPEAWSFSGKSIKARIGGYADIKYPVFKIAGFPVLILPRIWVPLRTRRHSGLLTPDLEFDSFRGNILNMKWFFVLSKSQDITLSTKWFEKGGLKPMAEYRYVLSQDSKGELFTSYFRDRKFEYERGQNRAFFTYNHYYNLPQDYVQRTQINWVSDLRYPLDFPDEMKGRGDPALENKFSVTKNQERSHFSAEATYHINLLKENPLDRNRDAIHRIPELRYSLAETQIGNTGLFANLDVNYVQFMRTDFSYDDVLYFATDAEYQTFIQSLPSAYRPNCYRAANDARKCINPKRDGAFAPKDLSGRDQDVIRTGHRFDIKPTISYPFQISKYFDFLSSATYQETQYRFNPFTTSTNSNYSDSAARRFVELDFGFRSKIARVYSLEDAPGETRIKHEVEPQITFVSIPWARRPDHPFFGDFADQPFSLSQEPVSDTDFAGDANLNNASGIQFDYNDRLFDKQLVNFALYNRLIRKRMRNDLPVYENIATLKLSQFYDFEELKGNLRQPWSAIEGNLDVRLDHFETNTKAIHYPYARLANISSRMMVKSSTGHYLQLSLARNYTRQAGNTFSKAKDDYAPGVGFNSKYFTAVGEVNYSQTLKGINSWSYHIHFRPPGNCWVIRLSQGRQAGREGVVYKVSADFQFGENGMF